jgi:hypothetical protein
MSGFHPSETLARGLERAALGQHKGITYSGGP